MDYLLALSATVFGWWFSTGIILYLNHLPKRTHRWSMAGMTVLFAVALHTVANTSGDTTSSGVLLAYAQALVIWGWLEMGYLMGFVTGPSECPCPPEASGWTRFSLALKTSLYHELLVVLVVFLVIARTAGGPNQVATLCCTVLWLMRWSAKLNLFLGIANFHAEWLPSSQRYLASYIKHQRINALLPVSVFIGSCLAWHFFALSRTGVSAADTMGNFIVGLLLSLAVLEHLFLVLPLNDSKLWQWALPNTVAAGQQAELTTHGRQ